MQPGGFLLALLLSQNAHLFVMKHLKLYGWFLLNLPLFNLCI